MHQYDPESFKVEPVEDRLVITAKYVTPLSDKKTEYGELNHSYRLPNAEIDTVHVERLPNGHVQIELPFNLDRGTESSDQKRYPVVSQDGSSVSYEYTLPSKVNPGNLDVSVDGRKVILRANDSYSKDASRLSASSFAGNGSFCFFHSVTFPVRTNFDSLSHDINGNLLTLNAQIAAQESLLSPAGSRTASRVSNSGTAASRLSNLASVPPLSGGSRTASRVSNSEQPALSGGSRLSNSALPESLSQQGSRTASRVSNNGTASRLSNLPVNNEFHFILKISSF